MLSDLLLFTGMCFFLGGLERPEQFFNETPPKLAILLPSTSRNQIQSHRMGLQWKLMGSLLDGFGRSIFLLYRVGLSIGLSPSFFFSGFSGSKTRRKDYRARRKNKLYSL
jgi:hypothetical protein